MDFYKQLKGHGVVEINQSTGLRTGHVIAQQPYAGETAYNAEGREVDYLDNGLLMKLNGKGELALAESLDGSILLHADEEHIKFLDSATLDMFTLHLDENEKTYPRAIALYEGDKFTTDMFKADGDIEPETFYAIGVQNGVIQVREAAEEAHVGPVAKLASLPTGKEAIEVLWRGVR